MGATTTKRDWTTTGAGLLSDAGRLVATDIVGRRCPVCGRRMYLGSSDRREIVTIDHLRAHHAGGSNDLGNLIPMCGSCNFSKGARELLSWLPGRLVKTGATKAKTASGQLRAAARCAAELEQIAHTLKLACEARGIK